MNKSFAKALQDILEEQYAPKKESVDEQTNDQLMVEYLEGYFGGELNESTSDEDIMEAFAALLETADAVEAFMVETGLVSAIAKHGVVGAVKAGVKAGKERVKKAVTSTTRRFRDDLVYGPQNIARRHLARKKAAGLENRQRKIDDFTLDDTNPHSNTPDPGARAARLRKVVGPGEELRGGV